MGKLSSFNFITLDGYLAAPDGDISWHRHGAEENQFAADNLQGGGTLLFGRVTYEMMANYWPTPMATQNDPTVAEGMNIAEKIVFSKTLQKADWNNTQIIGENIGEEINKMKQSGKNMVILGSGSIVTHFAEQGLIDEFQVMIDPVAIGNGIPLFKDIKTKLDLKLTSAKTFESGVVLLSYCPF